ncbi:MAG: hypothetical protein AB7T49_06890 [Oligoflexales bacterium]
MKSTACVILLLLFSTSCKERSAASGTKGGAQEGNGGSVIKCLEPYKEMNNQKTFLVDLYQGADRSGLKQEGGYKDIAMKAFKRVAAADPGRAEFYKEKLQIFSKDIEHGKILIPNIVTKIGIDYPISAPTGCILWQAAIQMSGQFDSMLKIDEGIWNELDEVNKAALLVHEVLYSEVILRQPKDKFSVKDIWKFTSFLFTPGEFSPSAVESIMGDTMFDATEQVVIDGAFGNQKVQGELFKVKSGGSGTVINLLWGTIHGQEETTSPDRTAFEVYLKESKLDLKERLFEKPRLARFSQGNAGQANGYGARDFLRLELNPEHKDLHFVDTETSLKFNSDWKMDWMVFTDGIIVKGIKGERGCEDEGVICMRLGMAKFGADGRLKSISSEYDIDWRSFGNEKFKIHDDGNMVHASYIGFNDHLELAYVRLNAPAKLTYSGSNEDITIPAGTMCAVYQESNPCEIIDRPLDER